MSDWKPERAELRAPLYLAIAERLAGDIVAGHLLPGSRLPPQRELADRLGVSLDTVTRAYTICERKGLIHGNVGSGTFVTSGSGAPAFTISDAYGRDCIELGTIEPFPQFNDTVARVVRDTLARPGLEQLLGFGFPTGFHRHKEAGKKWLALNGYEARAEDILVTSGTQNSLGVVLASLFQAGDRIATDLYTYPNFVELAKMLRIQLVPLASDEQGLLPDQLEEQCRVSRLRALYLVPSCNNPTAVVMTAERRKQIAAVVKKHDLLLIEDDVHTFLDFDGPPPIAALVPEKAIFLSNLSKAVTGGLRVSFMHAPESRRSALAGGIFSLNLKTPSMNAEVTAELILSGLAEDIARQKAALARERDKLMRSCFNAEPAPGRLQSLFWWLQLPEGLQGLSGGQFERLALEAGVRVFHSSRFRVGAPEREAFVRVSTCTVKSDAELLEGAERLKRLLAGGAGPGADDAPEARFII